MPTYQEELPKKCNMRKKNITMRQTFARDHKDWVGCTGEKKWRNILGSGETKINLFGNDCERNVRRPNGKEFHPRFTKKAVKHGGGNTMNGMGLLLLVRRRSNLSDYEQNEC